MLLSALLVLPLAAGDTPCAPGLKVGQKPGPYTFLVSTGPERGQLTCYV